MKNIELSKNEQYAKKWLAKNGFACDIVAQTNAATEWSVVKDGIEGRFSLPVSVRNIEKRMELFAQDWERYKELAEMREMLLARA